MFIVNVDLKVIGLLCLAVYLIMFVVRFYKCKKIHIANEILFILLYIYMFILIKIILFKHVDVQWNNPIKTNVYELIGISGIINFIPFIDIIKTILNHSYLIDSVIINLIGNIILFIPLTFCCSLLSDDYVDIRGIIILSIMCSFIFEATQLFMNDNYTDIDDIILNSIGGVIGFFMGNRFKSRLSISFEEYNLKMLLLIVVGSEIIIELVWIIYCVSCFLLGVNVIL